MAAITPEIESIIHRFIDLVQKKNRVFQAFLYGSHAKGVASKWSDIDLAVVSPDFSEDLFEERIRLMKLGLHIDERIEPLPFRPDDFDENEPIVNEIRKSGVQVV